MKKKKKNSLHLFLYHFIPSLSITNLPKPHLKSIEKNLNQPPPTPSPTSHHPFHPTTIPTTKTHPLSFNSFGKLLLHQQDHYNIKKKIKTVMLMAKTNNGDNFWD